MKFKRRYLYILLLLTALFFTACSSSTNIRFVSGTEEETPLPLIQPLENTPVPEAGEATPSPETGDISCALVLSEISSAGEDFLEFYNSGTADIALDDYRIGHSTDFSKAEPLPEYTLKAGAYVCVYGKNEEGELKVNLAFNKTADILYLFRNDGVLLYTVQVPALNKNISLVNIGGEWAYTYFKTPGEPNSDFVFTSLSPTLYAADCPLTVNEVLVSNTHAVADGYGEYSDFIEVYNPGTATVSLKGWFLSDTVEEAAKWAFPEVTLGPGEYICVYLSDRESTASELHAPFGLNGSETVVLMNGSENKYILFSLPETLISDISVGENGEYYRFPTPGYANAAAISDITKIGYFFADDVYISEVCAFGEESDWVELYNGSGETVTLSGWTLSDEPGSENPFRFGDVSLGAGEYYVVYATSHPSEQNGETAPFGISISGKTLYLTDSENRVRDVFYTGMSEDAASSGRIEADIDTDRVFFSAATPGKKNSGSYYTGRAAEPAFSTTSLYHTEAFSLVLTAESGAEIYYTSDGSEPKATSKQLYQGPISIKENTVIRAIAVKDGCLNSKAVCCTYLFEEEHSIPVISIAMSPSDKNAVWSAKSKQAKTKVEKEGYLSYYESDGQLGVSFPAGFKSKGAGTLGRSQASLSIHLRGKYGQSDVTYPFFEEYGWETYASLVVRNSGQDYQKARIRDSLASRLCLGLNIDVAATRPVAVYVNGKYYGLYDLNEDQNADFLHTHYGVDTRTVEIIRFNTVTVKGSNTNWKKIIEYAKTKNFKDDSVYEEFIEYVDPDYFIDYLVCSIYLCNSDMANQKYWHTTDNTIRWRAIFYDFDYAMGFNRSAKSSILERFFDSDGTATATSRIYTYIACALVKNPTWKQQFIERYIELTYTTFDPERVNGIIDELAGEMETEMARHIAKWGSRNAPASVKEWKESISELKDWFSKRQSYAIESLKKYFKLSDDEIDAVRSRYI